jgi:hypothetical protein
MAATEYDRGFVSGLEYARMALVTCYNPLDGSAFALRDHLDRVMLAAVAEAQRDPAKLRRRLMDIYLQLAPEPTKPAAPTTQAEIVSLAERRQAAQLDRGNRHRRPIAAHANPNEAA